MKKLTLRQMDIEWEVYLENMKDAQEYLNTFELVSIEDVNPIYFTFAEALEHLPTRDIIYDASLKGYIKKTKENDTE